MNEPLTLKNPNLFQIESGPTKATGAAVSIRCPHCHELGQFGFVHDLGISFSKQLSNTAGKGYLAAVRICPNTKCRGLVFAISHNNEVELLAPPELIKFDVEGLPATLAKTLKEAVACHGSGADRAAAMMVRRLLEEICQENGAEGDNLHKRLESLRSKVVLPQKLFDAMDELKLLGNDAAHVEAREYDNIGPKQAEAAIELAQEIVKALYQLEGLIKKLRDRK